jgi:hypothetical protein
LVWRANLDPEYEVLEMGSDQDMGELLGKGVRGHHSLSDSQACESLDKDDRHRFRQMAETGRTETPPATVDDDGALQSRDAKHTLTVEPEHVPDTLFIACNVGESYDRIVGALERYHADRGVADPLKVAMTQARVLVLLVVDQSSQETIARSIGETPRKVARHMAHLRTVFPELAKWERTPKTGSLPALASSRPSRHREKAPADGRWRDLGTDPESPAERVQEPCG